MSYDLFFHKRKNSTVTTGDIANYLNGYLRHEHEDSNQWMYVNEDTGVYFFIERARLDPGEEVVEISDFVNTGYSFHLNFIRPSFFGIEAFPFIDQFTRTFDLFIENPQSDTEEPIKTSATALQENWNTSNLQFSADMFNETGAIYLSPYKASLVWQHNMMRGLLQDKLGDNYFVPRVVFLKEKATGEAATLAVWTEHIPSIIPPADYFLLTRRYKKLFRKITDEIIVSRKTILEQFGSFFDRYDDRFDIIHPNNALKIGKKFNSLRGEFSLPALGETITADKILNAKPT